MKIFKDHLRNIPAYSGGKGKQEMLSLIGDNKLYKLSSNENLLGSSPKAIAAIQEHIADLNEYPPRQDEKLRMALSQFYQNGMKAENFFTGNSGVALIELICRAFLSYGDEIIVSTPTFKPYKSFSKKIGAITIDIPLDPIDYNISIEGIINAISSKTRIIFLTSPNNPTGTHIPKDQLKYLLDHIPDHVVVVYDEVYYQFADASDYSTALPFVQQGYPIIGLNSFSKAYGLAGLRVGYAYSTQEIAEYISLLRRPFMINSLSLHAAIAALKDDDFIQATTHLIQTEKLKLYDALNSLDIHYWKTQANFILIKPNFTEKEFEDLMIREGIMVRPVGMFDAPGCVRVTIGTPQANQAYIKALKNINSN